MKKLFLILIVGLILTGCSYKLVKVDEEIKELDTQSIASKTLECLELWGLKKERYFGEEIGNYRVIYNKELDTCLVGNIYDQKMNTGYGDKYFIFVMDLITDEVLFSYLTRGDFESLDETIEWEEAIEKYESFGLRVF